MTCRRSAGPVEVATPACRMHASSARFCFPLTPAMIGRKAMAATFGLLSTHPPTRCGLASFNGALAAQLTTAGRAGGVVRVTAAGDDQRPGLGEALAAGLIAA